MRQRGIVCLVAVVVTLLVAWGISVGPPNIHSTARNFQNFLGIPDATPPPVITTPSSPHKCGLSRRCPVDYFAFHISSGAADVVGPKICFDGKTIMSNVYNNVAHGLNVVLINGENGKVENISTFNMNTGEKVLAFLKAIQNGTIVLVASFDDVTRKMSDEMREMLAGLGSTMIRSVKHRDSWVFAGGAGTGVKSPFEKRATSDPKTNIYGAWPEVVEVGGCFPRKM